MVVKKEFAEEVAVLLRGKLNGVDIQVRDVVKNNGVRLTGLVFQERDSLLAPCIYLENFYEEYRNGIINMEMAVDEIISVYDRERKAPEFDVPAFLDYSRISSRLHGRLVNTEKNAGLLERLPHRDILDLSLIYYVEVPGLGSGEGTGSIRVENGHMQSWGVSEDELYNRAMQNMQAEGRATILKMEDILGTALWGGCAGEPEEGFSMYVLTNSVKMYGAAQMLDSKALETAAGIFGSDFYILPSSVHETILIPAVEEKGAPEDIARIVQEVNAGMVLEDEILSYHVYRYYAGSRQIQIAA